MRPIRIPWPGSAEQGLGDAAKSMLARLGVRPCGGCARRAAALNSMLVLSAAGPAGRSARRAPRWAHARGRQAAAGQCWSFTGGCTGFGHRQCVEAPATQEPDAEIITQCCGGWFQYPWIEVCPGQRATQGCGFCLW